MNYLISTEDGYIAKYREYVVPRNEATRFESISEIEEYFSNPDNAWVNRYLEDKELKVEMTLKVVLPEVEY